MPLTSQDVAAIRAQFPAFARRINGRPLVYLDSASTAQKPRAVLDALAYANEAAANIHRGVHTLSVEATEAYESVRGRVARFIGASDPREIVFVRGATEGLNLVAQSWGRANVNAGDEIVVTALEHHSNLVPWQMLCRERGARLSVLPIDARGDVVLEALGPRTRLVAVSHLSNSLGTVVPVAEIARRAHEVGAVVVVDGAQSIAHRPVDVAALGADFFVFSGHKLYGPTGGGVLWSKLLDAMPPWQGGGDMILSVSFEETTYREAPHRFEAGTPDIAAVIGLGAAIDWIQAIGMERVATRESALLDYALTALSAVPDLRFVGSPRERAAVVSFNLGDIHPHDVGTALDAAGVAVRTGHHCTQPVMDHFNVDGTVRASLGIYSTETDIDALVAALSEARALLR